MENSNTSENMNVSQMIHWQWQSIIRASNSESGNKPRIEWIPFCFEDSVLIEQAYQSLQHESQEIILTDKTRVVDIYHAIVYDDKAKCSEKRLVRRCGTIDRNAFGTPNGHRRYRFSNPADNHFAPFDYEPHYGSQLMELWYLHFGRVNKRVEFHLGTFVDTTIETLRAEAEKLGEEEMKYGLRAEVIRSQAIDLCEELTKVRKASNDDICKCAVRLYTSDTFLFRMVNQTLRSRDNSIYNDPLIAFYFLLRAHLFASEQGDAWYRGTVYRGEWLHPTMIEKYSEEATRQEKLKAGVTNPWLIWLGFTSTTKRRETAELIGNTLFEIELGGTVSGSSRGADISRESLIPAEDEVLLPAGFQFECLNVMECERTINKPYRNFAVRLRARQQQ